MSTFGLALTQGTRAFDEGQARRLELEDRIRRDSDAMRERLARQAEMDAQANEATRRSQFRLGNQQDVMLPQGQAPRPPQAAAAPAGGLDVGSIEAPQVQTPAQQVAAAAQNAENEDQNFGFFQDELLDNESVGTVNAANNRMVRRMMEQRERELYDNDGNPNYLDRIGTGLANFVDVVGTNFIANPGVAIANTGQAIADFGRGLFGSGSSAPRPGVTPPAEEQAPQQQRQEEQYPFQNTIVAAAERYGVEPNVMARIAQAESNFDPTAVSPAGARGLFQILPSAHPDFKEFDNPVASAEYASQYMAELLEQSNGNYPLASAMYNWGMGNLRDAIERAQRTGKQFALPSETKKYLNKIYGDGTAEQLTAQINGQIFNGMPAPAAGIEPPEVTAPAKRKVANLVSNPVGTTSSQDLQEVFKPNQSGEETTGVIRELAKRREHFARMARIRAATGVGREQQDKYVAKVNELDDQIVFGQSELAIANAKRGDLRLLADVLSYWENGAQVQFRPLDNGNLDIVVNGTTAPNQSNLPLTTILKAARQTYNAKYAERVQSYRDAARAAELKAEAKQRELMAELQKEGYLELIKQRGQLAVESLKRAGLDAKELGDGRVLFTRKDGSGAFILDPNQTVEIDGTEYPVLDANPVFGLSG